MAFSKVPDTSFTWVIPDFEESLNSSCDKSLFSPKFTTSRDPNRKWYMCLFLNEKSIEHCDRCKTYEKYLKKNREEIILIYQEKNYINLHRKKNPSVKDSLQNVNALPRTCIPKVDRKSLGLEFKCTEFFEEALNFKVELSIVNPTGKMFSRSFIFSGLEESNGFHNFIQLEDLTKILQDGKLEILAEIMFPKSGIEKNNFEDFLDAEFLSDVELPVGEDRISAHKASRKYSLERFHSK